MATQEAAVCNAGVQSQQVIALFAAPAGRGGHFEEAKIVGTPGSTRYVEEENVFRRLCMRHLAFTGTLLSYNEPID